MALIADGRFSGGSHGFVVGHIAPEVAVDGLLAVVRNGDIITIDAVKRTLHVEVSESELRARLKKWRAPNPKYTRGVLGKYVRWVGSAAFGALTDR